LPPLTPALLLLLKIHRQQLKTHQIIPPIGRCSLLAALTVSIAATPFAHNFLSPMSAQEAAFARGLFQMPPFEYESIGVINKNLVAKTSVDNGLSQKGKKQAVRSAFDLNEMGACGKNCWIWPSITQRAYPAAEIIAAVNGVSRSYIVPEYSFLDACGLEAVSEVYASDTLSPNESVSDVFVRYSEDTVIIVSPHSDNLTVLQAGIIGLDLCRGRGLSFAPEVRLVDTNSVPTYKQPASAVYKCLRPPNCSSAQLAVRHGHPRRRFQVVRWVLLVDARDERVDYTTVFVFRMLMFVDNGLASGMGLDFGWQQRYARFCGRVVVLSILSLLLYPFLWTWTVLGTLWFHKSKDCLPESGQKWGFLIWLLFSYCALLCIACMSIGKWLTRREAHLLRAQQGIPVSEYGVLVDMIRVPDWAFEAAGQETRGMGQDAAAFQPGLYLTQAQREAVEALIQELPKFRLKAVPTDCSECPICLEEFHVGNEVRGLPCAHNFHVECIDEWLRLNVKCPRCRCSVFPNLDLSAISNLRPDSERSSLSVLTTNRYVRTQPDSQRHLLRLQGAFCPVRTENAGAGNEADAALETAEEGGIAHSSTRDLSSPRAGPSIEHIIVVESASRQQQ
ncbi:hypothetical protein DVH24_008738, partial [Malus domestica]